MQSCKLACVSGANCKLYKLPEVVLDSLSLSSRGFCVRNKLPLLRIQEREKVVFRGACVRSHAPQVIAATVTPVEMESTSSVQLVDASTAPLVMDSGSAATESVFRVSPAQAPVSKVKKPGNGFGQTKLGRPTTGALEVDGFSIEGVSVGGQETCVMLPALKVAFDIGRCPERAIYQDYLFITHPHMDHIGGLCMYVASRGLLKMKVPTVIVPKCVKATVEKLFAVQRELDDSPLPVNLIGMDIGEEFDLGKGLVVKAFKTYHVVPSQGYVIYSVKQKLKPEYTGLSGNQIKGLKASCVEITETMKVPEVAFTGDTTAEFILDEANKDALNAKLLIMEVFGRILIMLELLVSCAMHAGIIQSTFLDDYMSIENAQEYGHTHLFQIMELAERFKNRNLVLIHFSARYKQEDIFKAINALPPPLKGRVVALTEGF